MGTSTLLDIIGSTVIGGILLLTLWRVNDSTVDNHYYYSNDLMVQKNLITIVQIIENDFKKIGYCKDPDKIPNPTKSIRLADSSKIRFYTDTDNDGDLDSLYYYLGPTSELRETPNPRDRILYRQINNQTPYGGNLGVTEFKIEYFDALGNSITSPVVTPSQIAMMQISVQVENISAYKENYSNAYWRQVKLAARNLKNR